MQPLQFQPMKQDVDSVSLETHNAVVEELAKVKDELARCRQKVAHLLKALEKESQDG